MRLKILPDVELYSSNVDKNKIFAEFIIPPWDEDDIEIYKFASVDSPEFESFLRMVILPERNDDKSECDIIEEIKDYHRLRGNKDTVSPRVRTAGKLRDGLIEYALYNTENQVISITPNGYSIVNKSENKFVQHSTNAAQISPKKTDRSLLELMSPYVSTDESHLILFAVWLIQAVCEGNHSALIIIAKAGSGKTTLTKFIRQILDPSNLDATKMFSKGDGLITTLTNSYLVTFDNMRELTKDDSDTLCVAVTGGVYAKREAYSTNSLSIFDLHNTIVINTIELIPEESDFAQRCLCLPLESVEDKRVSDSKIKKNFKHDLPYILHSIFTTISKAMSIIDNVSPKRKPRMLDSYEEMLAIAIALDISEEKFENIYFNNIEYINKLRSNNDLVDAVREYMTKYNNGRRSIEGKAYEVYSKIRNSYSGNKSSLPGSVSHFSRKLKSEYASLLAAGFIVNIDDTGEEGTYIKIIKNKK